MLLRRRQSALGRLGGNRDERPDMTHARVVCARAEVDLDELGRGTSAALREHRRRGRVGAHLGIAVLDEQRGETGEVGARFGDLERDVGRALERRPELAGRDSAPRRRSGRRSAVSASRYASASACASGETRARNVSAWPIAPPASGQCSFDARATMATSPAAIATTIAAAEPAAGSRPFAGERVEEVAERRVEQVVASHRRPILSQIGYRREACAHCLDQRGIRLEARRLERLLEVGDQRVTEGSVGAGPLDDVVEPASRERDLLRSLHPRLRRGGQSAKEIRQGFLVVVAA